MERKAHKICCTSKIFSPERFCWDSYVLTVSQSLNGNIFKEYIT